MQTKTAIAINHRIWDSFLAVVSDRDNGGMGWSGDEYCMQFVWPAMNSARYSVLRDATGDLQSRDREEVAAYLNGEIVRGKLAHPLLMSRAAEAMSY